MIADLSSFAPSRGQAWDVGTGNGQAARQLAAHFDHVHASDPSAEQIDATSPADRVTFAVEPAEESSLADGSVDLILAAQSLHWFDQPRFGAEARRLLKPGGILAAIGYSWFTIDAAVDEVIECSFLQPLQPLWAPQNLLLWDGYRTLDLPGVEVPIEPPAIERNWTREGVLDYLRTWSATQKWLAAADEGQGFAAAADALREVWPNDLPRLVTMPMVVRVRRLS